MESISVSQLISLLGLSRGFNRFDHSRKRYMESCKSKFWFCGGVSSGDKKWKREMWLRVIMWFFKIYSSSTIQSIISSCC